MKQIMSVYTLWPPLCHTILPFTAEWIQGILASPGTPTWPISNASTLVEAIALYEKFLKEGPHKYPYPSLSRLALAECYVQSGNLQKAVKILKVIVSGADGFFKEQAVLDLARIYPLLNQKEKAVEILKEFVSKYKASPFLPMAKAHLAGYGS